MAVPENVKKQADNAAKLQQEHIDTLAKEANVDEKPPVEQTVLTGEDNPNPDEDLTIRAPDRSKEKVDRDDWEERFARYKASTDEELHRLRTELKNKAEAVKEAQEEKERSEAEAAQQNEIKENELTDDEIETYGPDLVNIIKRASKVELAKNLLDLTRRMDALEQGQQSIVETTSRTDKDRFFDALTDAAPNWKKDNRDDRFNDWLDDEMPGTGFDRRHFLSTAFNNSDVIRVAKFFTDWADLNGSSQQSIDHRIQGDRVRGGGESIIDATDAKIYTSAEIDKFYRDKRERRYVGRETEARNIEKDILLASQQGRVR